jgi:hypothetical protein
MASGKVDGVVQYLNERKGDTEMPVVVCGAMDAAESSDHDVGGSRWGMLIRSPEPFFSRVSGSVWSFPEDLSRQDTRSSREVVARMRAIESDLAAKYGAPQLRALAPE